MTRETRLTKPTTYFLSTTLIPAFWSIGNKTARLSKKKKSNANTGIARFLPHNRKRNRPYAEIIFPIHTKTGKKPMILKGRESVSSESKFLAPTQQGNKLNSADHTVRSAINLISILIFILNA